MLVDVIVPVAPFHSEVAQRAIASVQAQTFPAQLIVIEDTQQRGAAFARNQGVQRATGLFLTFLDADDILAPSYIETCLKAWVQRGKGYIYTDWLRAGKVYSPHNLSIWREGLYHIVTTLLPRKAFDAVGGFDETLPTLEDEDLYRRVQALGVCPYHVAEPLVEYRASIGHSVPARNQHLQAVETYFNKRDGHYRDLNMCACDEDQIQGETHISGQYHQGDVLALATYTPRRMNSKTQVNRVYEKPMMGHPMWVHPADVQVRPDLWQLALTQETLTPDVETVLSLMRSA